MIKVVYHIADIHIRLFKRHLEYQTVLDDFYKEVIKDIKRRKLNKEEVRIAIAGDMVHSKNQMTPELVSFVIKMLNDCTNICKTVIILGNHDFLANNLDRMDALSPLIESLGNDDILFYKDTGCYEDNNVIWCVFSQVTESDRPNIEESKNKYPDKTHNKKAYMVGSLIQQNFGESTDNHGFCIVDIDKDKYSFKDIENNWGFYTFKINSIEDIEKEKEILL